MKKITRDQHPNIITFLSAKLEEDMGYTGLFDPNRTNMVAGLSDPIKTGSYQPIEVSNQKINVNSTITAPPAHVSVEIGKGRVIETNTVQKLGTDMTHNGRYDSYADQAWSPGSSPEPSPENKRDVEFEMENDQKPDPTDLSKDPGSFRYPDVTHIGTKEPDSSQKPKKNRDENRQNIVNRALISKRTRSVVVMPIKIKNEPKGIKNYFR